MTLINSWWYRGADRADESERQLFIECDTCLPPRGTIGTAAQARARGWACEDIDAGSHHCPWCARAAKRRRRPKPRRWTAAEKSPALPNFLVIGAAKCGTTSLHRYLSAHPEIHMPPAKELKFFHRPNCLEELESYSTFFDGTAPARGESSPTYSCDPIAPGVPARVHAAIPGVKLIYLVRDPVERAVSDYIQEIGQDRESRPFAEAVGDVADPYNRYVAGGEYATQLGHYLRLFARESVLVVDRNQLLADRESVLRRIFGFLGVDQAFTSRTFADVLNTRDTKVRWTPIGRKLLRSNAARAVRALPPRTRGATFAPVKRLVTRRLESPRIDPELEHRLREHFRPELERLRALTGPSFQNPTS